MSSSSTSSSSSSSSSYGSGAPPYSEQDVLRTHWMADEEATKCCLPGCNTEFGYWERKHHCRHCGLIFCTAHCSLERKLNRRAKIDPNGVWCKVCDGCMAINTDPQGMGVRRDRTELFMAYRKPAVFVLKERTDTILDRLGELSWPPWKRSSEGEKNTGLWTYLGGTDTEQVEFEQSVVKWQDDRGALSCPGCGSVFGLLNRKHHCRLCGLVYCGTCTDYYLSLAQSLVNPHAAEDMEGQVRVCVDCDRLVLKREQKLAYDAKRALGSRHPLYIAHEVISPVFDTLDSLIVELERAVASFDEEDARNDADVRHMRLVMATEIQKQVADFISMYEKRIKELRSLDLRKQKDVPLHTSLTNTYINHLTDIIIRYKKTLRRIGRENKRDGQRT